MHYYQFNIGDYAKATRHLSNTEDLAYRRLIDLYYDKEQPLIKDVSKLSRLINMRENHEEIKTVLEDFFTETEEGYQQSRIDSEIANYHAKADAARANGKKGGRPKKAKANPDETEGKAKKTKSVNLANPDETEGKAKKSESKANHKPITNNQEPLTSNQLEKPMSAKANPAFDLFKYWCDVMGKNLSTSKLTAKRDKAIKARLKEGYTVDQIKQAIDGCRNDPFSMGQNDRQKPFNDIELICRTGEKLESFMETIGNEKIINGQSTPGRKLSALERQQLRLQEKYGNEPGQPSGGLGMAEDGRDLRGTVGQGEWRGTVIDVEDSPE